jgi:4-amino-4-deoxy-L-arabinose transferase-like glycosyltransferase
VGASAILAGFTAAILLGNGYVDWLVFLLALGAMNLLAAWRQDGTRRSLLLAGVFTGLAIGSKYTSGVLALAGLVVLAFQLRRRPLAFLRAALLYGLAAGVAALPWLLKNLLATGNPFYPFFFSGGAMTAVRLQVYQSVPSFGNWLDFFLLPARATSLGFDAGEGYMFAPGMLLLGLGALAWLDKFLDTRQDDALTNYEKQPQRGVLFSTAVVLAVAGLVVWAVGNRLSGNLIQTRYYFSIFPAFAVLAAAGERGLRRLNLGPVRMGRIGATLILLAVVFNGVEVNLAALKNGAPQAVLGLKSQEAYLADALGWFEPAMKAVRELPDGKRALLIYEARSLYCAPRCLPDEILDRWKRAHLELGDPAAILQSWRAEGITHLLVYRQGMRLLLEVGDPHHPASDLAALDQFLSTFPRPVSFGDVYELYSLD